MSVQLFGKIRPDFYRHHKTRSVSVAARGIWVCGLAYCRDNNTDGFIAAEDFPMLYLGDDIMHAGQFDVLAFELEQAGFWSRVTERDGVTVGFEMCDYDEHQLSTGKIEERREKARLRKRRQRERESLESSGSEDNTADVTRDGHTPVTVSQNVTPLEVEEDAEEEEQNTSAQQATPPTFQQFWAAYPVKKGRKQAETTWARLSQTNRQQAIDSINNYKQSVKDPQYWKHGSTYLAQQPWRDDLTRPRDDWDAWLDGEPLPIVGEPVEVVEARFTAMTGEQL